MKILKKGQRRVTVFALAFICVFSLVGALLPSGVVKANENVEIPICKNIDNTQMDMSVTELATGQYNIGSISLENNELPQTIDVPEPPHDGWAFVGMRLYYIKNYNYSSEENDCFFLRYNLEDKGYVYDEDGNYIDGNFNGSYYVEENGQKFPRIVLIPCYKIENPFNLYLVGLDNNMEIKNEGMGVLSTGSAEIYPTDVFVGFDAPIGGVEGNYNLFMYYLNYAELPGGLEALQEYATDLPENIKPIVAVFNLGGGSWLAGTSSNGTLWSNGWQYSNNSVSAIDTGIDTTAILQDIESQRENLNPLLEQLGAQIEAGEITEDEAIAQYSAQYNQIVDSHKEELKEMVNSLPELGYDLTVPVPEGCYINDLSKILNVIPGYYGGNTNLMYIDRGGVLHDTTHDALGNKVSYNSDSTFDYTVNNNNTITIKVRPLAVIDPTTNHIVLMYAHVYTPGILICFKPNVVNINLEDAYFANENLDNDNTYVLEGTINRSEKKLTYRSDDDNQNPVIQKNKAVYNEQEDKWEDYVLTGFYDENDVKYFDSDFNAVKEWDEGTETYTLYAKYEKNEPINQDPGADDIENDPVNPDNEPVAPPIIPIVPTPNFEPEPSVEVRTIKEIAPVITRENGKYVVKAEENANYTVSNVADSKTEPYFDGENINIINETLLMSKNIKLAKLADGDFNKYVVLSLKAKEGYKFDDELVINLPKEYGAINANIKGDNATIVIKYNNTSVQEESKPEDEVKDMDIVDNSDIPDENIDVELKEGSNFDNKANETNYANSFTDNTLTARNEEYTSSQTVVNESKAINVPKTDDNIMALLIAVGVMMLIAGTGTVILCKRYC